MKRKRGRRFARFTRSSVKFPSTPGIVSAALLSMVVWCLAGCEKKPPAKSEMRAVTAEIVAAAQRATAHNSEIAIRPEPSTGGPSASRSGTDDIYVTLADPSQFAALSKSIGDIARRHDFFVGESTSGGVTRFDLSAGGTRTHTVHVVTPVKPLARPADSHSDVGPRLAIILDDLGYERAAANSALALPFPLTVSVLPNLPLSSDVAEEAYRRGDEVLLHLPMESESNDAKTEAVELRIGMTAQQVQTELDGMLETVPHVVGVNNHQGSRATADPALMNVLMPALRARNLFFIDSRTSAATVAYDAAAHAGVRAASRKVFLDDAPSRQAILVQLDLAVRDAMRDGYAIAIGHPHPGTIAALAEGVPRAEQRGVRLVLASDVVR